MYFVIAKRHVKKPSGFKGTLQRTISKKYNEYILMFGNCDFIYFYVINVSRSLAKKNNKYFKMYYKFKNKSENTYYVCHRQIM